MLKELETVVFDYRQLRPVRREESYNQFGSVRRGFGQLGDQKGHCSNIAE